MQKRIDGRNLTREEVKDQKREEAQSRQKKHDKLTPEQKLAKLDKKLGKGKGAKKERKRLQNA